MTGNNSTPPRQSIRVYNDTWHAKLKRLSGSALKVYIALEFAILKDGNLSGTRPIDIAARSGVGKTAIREAINELEEAGVIDLEQFNSKYRKMKSQQTWLYKMYNESGALLYIGISNNSFSRFGNHEHEKEWADEVRSWERFPYPTRGEALTAEASSIKAERPLYNVIHNGMEGK